MVKFHGPCHELAENWALAASVVQRQTARPVLLNVKLTADREAKSLRLAATDLDVSLNLLCEKFEIEQSGAVLLPAEKTGQVLQALAHEDIRFAREEQTAVIRTARDRMRLNAGDVDDFPALPDFDDDKALFIKQQDYRDMLDRVFFAVATEPLRYALNGVLLVVKTSKLEFVGTDGHRLAHIERKYKFADEYPENLIVPVRGLRTLERLLTAEDKFLALNIQGNQIVGKASRGIASTKLLEGQFPNFREVIPQNMEYKVTLDRAAFSEALSKAMTLVSPESQGVTFDFRQPGVVKLTSHAPEAGDSEVELAIEGEQEGPRIAFIGRYVQEFLKAAKESEITLELRDPGTGGIFRAGKDFYYLVMPVNT